MAMTQVYINAIATAVPNHDVHQKFIDYCPRLLSNPKLSAIFSRIAQRTQIEHRYSFFKPHEAADKLDAADFYKLEKFPSTQQRMVLYENYSFRLAQRALDQLDLENITHLIITSCTGFYAPGLDYQIIQHYGLSANIERSMVGFMGCYAAINALKLARHIVRSESNARVLMVNIELCTLHLKPAQTLEEILPFLIFSDGCAASVLSSSPSGLEVINFKSTFLPGTEELITWRIGDLGFDMNLSGQVPGVIAAQLPLYIDKILDGCTRRDITHWAVHPGGRTILDAVRDGLQLGEEKMMPARTVLREYGNMSSATVMFVLKEMLIGDQSGEGCAIAFGPGLSVESMRFRCN